MELTQGEEISIWSETDIEYEGGVVLRFRMEILKDGGEYGALEMDPTDKNITMGEVKTTVMNKTN